MLQAPYSTADLQYANSIMSNIDMRRVQYLELAIKLMAIFINKVRVGTAHVKSTLRILHNRHFMRV